MTQDADEFDRTLIEIFESYGKVKVDHKHTQQHEEGGKHRGVATYPAIQEI
jgi:hypothetical protein